MAINLKHLGAMALFVMTTHVCNAASTTVGELEDVATETMLLKAQAKRADAANELAAKKGGAIITNGRPVLQAVVASDAGTRVSVACDGEVGDAVVGGRVPCGWQVEKIYPDTLSAVLRKEKEHLTLELTRPLSSSRRRGDSAQAAPITSPAGPQLAVPALGR
jgi:hypothetical protein